MTPEMSACGTSSSEAWMVDRSRAFWAKRMIGKPTATTSAPVTAIASEEMVKVRSLKRDSGINGSAVVLASHAVNSPRTTTPPAISAQIQPDQPALSPS